MRNPNNSSILYPEITIIAKGAGIIFIGMTIGTGLRYLFEFIVARNLGPDLFGSFFLGFSAIKIAEIVSTLGLHRGVLRFVAIFQSAGDVARTKGAILFSIRTTLVVSLILGIFMFMLSPFVSLHIFHKAGLASVFRLFALIVPFIAVTTILVFCTQGFKIMKYRVFVRELFEPGIRIIAVVFLFILGFKLNGAIFAFIASILLGTILALVYTKKSFPPLIDKSTRPIFESKEILKYSWPLLLAEFFGLIIMWINILMIGYFKSSGEVGIYSASHRTALLGEVIFLSFNAIFSPITADLYYRKEHERLAHLFKLVNKWIFALNFPVCLLLVFFASDLLRLFGNRYLPGTMCLVLLGTAQLVNSALGSSGFLIMMSGKSRINLINNIFTALLNIGLNVLLIPAYGILGAALSFLASVIVVNLVMVVEVYALFRIHPFRTDMYKSPLAGGISFISMALLMRFLRWTGNPILLMGTGSMIFLLSYIILINALGIGEEDKMVLQSLKAKLLVSK